MAGEQLLLLSNPRGRRRDAMGRFVKRGSTARRSNPRPAKSTKRKGRARPATAIVTTTRTRAVGYRRNPRGAFLTTLTDGAMPAAIGAGGALAADFGLSFLPVPERMKTGWLRHLTRAGAAVLLGGVASYLVRPQLALQIGTGALTVAFHGAMKDALARMLPEQMAARLGDYDEIDLAALGIYSSGPVEEQSLNAFERRLGQADDDNGMAAFEQSMNGLADTIEF